MNVDDFPPVSSACDGEGKSAISLLRGLPFLNYLKPHNGIIGVNDRDHRIDQHNIILLFADDIFGEYRQ